MSIQKPLKKLSGRDVLRCAAELFCIQAESAVKEKREEDAALFHHLMEQCASVEIQKGWLGNTEVQIVQSRLEMMLRRQNPSDRFLKLRVITGQK